MATLSFNPPRIKFPSLHSHIPISKSQFLPKSSNISFLLSSKNYQQLHHFKPNSISESSVSVPKEAEFDDPTSELSYLDTEMDPSSITEWELDFCSRPILDVRGKKIWELVVCDRSLSLQYTKYFPNNVINSINLKDAIASISEDLGVPTPEKVRFFWSQMQTIITKACKELGIKPVPNKRLTKSQTHYSEYFQEAGRYTSEVRSVEADTARACLILSVGISTRYVYATYKKTPITKSEADDWEAAKKACGGLHFLAIQEDLDSDDCVGFWLLLASPPHPI